MNEWYYYIGNMGNLMIILVPAICDEEGSPFGNRSVCRSIGLSYASFSMAVSQNQTYIIISAQSFVMIIVTFFFGPGVSCSSGVSIFGHTVTNL